MNEKNTKTPSNPTTNIKEESSDRQRLLIRISQIITTNCQQIVRTVTLKQNVDDYTLTVQANATPIGPQYTDEQTYCSLSGLTEALTYPPIRWYTLVMLAELDKIMDTNCYQPNLRKFARNILEN